MHSSSLEVMQSCIDHHVRRDSVLAARSGLTVLDVGGADVNGTYRDLFTDESVSYTAIDLQPGAGVHLVVDGDGTFPVADRSYDLVLAGQVFEHASRFWELFDEMVRVVKDDGVIIVIAPSAGPEHRYPVDCYRFYPDSFAALAESAGMLLVDVWRDSRGPFYDLVGVFRRTESIQISVDGPPPVPGTAVQNSYPDDVDPSVEVRAGSEPTIEFLARVHAALQPRTYLEIGVETGASLRLATCPAIGVDPVPELNAPLSPNQSIAYSLSNDFFREEGLDASMRPLDLAYVDGMHLIENALMDFMNIERNCAAGSVVLIDDIYPNHVVQGHRTRSSRHWTGDVWKMVTILQSQRPDLILLPIDTEPTGTLMVLGLDPDNDVLWERHAFVIEYAVERLHEPPAEILERTGSFHPADPIITKLLQQSARLRADPDGSGLRARQRSLLEGALPRRVVTV